MIVPVQISKRFLFWFLLVVNILFIFYGVTILLTSLLSKKTKVSDILFGILDIAVGICGLVGLLKRIRVLLTVYVGLQGLQLVLVIIALIGQPFLAAYMIKEKNAEVKNAIIRKYGAPDEAKFTAKINGFQVKRGCCHFFGDPAENIFLKTPWYVIENHGKPTSQAMRTLPDFCCVKAEDVCRAATDIKEAISNGAVVAKDCSDAYAEKINKLMVMVLVWLIVAILLQIPIILITIIGMYQNKYFFFQEEADFTDE